MSNEKLTIVSNHKPYRLCSFLDLPVKVQKDFDYIESDSQSDERFVKYRGCWYDVEDSQRIRVRSDGRQDPMGFAMYVDKDSPLSDWTQIISETFFSGVVFAMYDYDNVICGRYST